MKGRGWSFSTEWDCHFDARLRKTWGWEVDQRVRQFLLEVEVTEDWCRGKFILDAGCGNGQLSEGLTSLGASVVGVDYSTSVFRAQEARRSRHVHFVRGDLQLPPFAPATFDVVLSNGVLHHTRNTFATFAEVAKLVKPGGRLYVWLYRKPESFSKRYVVHLAVEFARTIASRLPRVPQAVVVRTYAFALVGLHRLLGKRRDLSWPERVVGAYDRLTPLYRHCHTPLEVASWFFLCGYSPPTITHWDNPSGFGMFAIKRAQEETPGVNYGKATVTRRHWE